MVVDSLPSPLRGMVVAGLLAAAMSTFDSTVNAAAAYWVNDCYKLLRPGASEAQLMWQGRVASVVIVVLGALFSLSFDDINAVWGWVRTRLRARRAGAAARPHH